MNVHLPHLPGKTVLIAEDERDLREPLAMEFRALGCTVFEAGNGRQAFAIVQREKIDAVVSDIRMPGGDGIELLKNIKSLHQGFPVVMLITGFADLPRCEAYDLGAEAILSKPFDLDEIDAALNRILTPKESCWRQPIDAEKLRCKIQKEFASLAQAQREGALALGRGGVYLRALDTPVQIGKQLAFHVNFSEERERALDGSGIVRWHRKTDDGVLPAGVGIEFEFLSDASRASLLQLTEISRTVAFIPRAPRF